MGSRRDGRVEVHASHARDRSVEVFTAKRLVLAGELEIHDYFSPLAMDLAS